MSNLVREVAETVEEQPSEPAIAFEGTKISYQELWDQVGGFANGLRAADIDPGGRVAVYLPNLPEFVVSFYGTLRAGGAVVPMNPQYKSREIEYLLNDSGARVVVTLAELVPFVEEVREETDIEHIVTVEGEPDEVSRSTESFESFLGNPAFETTDRDAADVACQPYTSGTTGRSKGVILTHENLRSNAAVSTTFAPGEDVGADDRTLGVLPLFHIFGMTVGMNGTLFSGGEYWPLPSWDVQQALDVIESVDISLFHGVPAMYNDIITADPEGSRDLSSIRLAIAGGAGIPREVLRQFEDLYDAIIYEGYGLTETSPVTHQNRPSIGRRVGSIGGAIPGVQARIVDENFEEVSPVVKGPVEDTELNAITGEIVINGPNIARGYQNRPEANQASFTEADGKRWFHTGDIGYRDEDSFFYVVDRKKHVIVTGGYNVYPREVEELLFEHEAVSEAAIVGIPDDRRGRTVKAFVVSDTDVTEDEIREYCLSNLAEYKHPREVTFVDELPRTTTGKVQKFKLSPDSA